MTFFFGESFDLYNNMADGISGYWDAASLNPGSSGLQNGRFAGGRSLNISSSTTLQKTSNQNDAVHHFVLGFMCSNITGSSGGLSFTLVDGATAQCSVVFRNDGAIEFRSGGNTGTVLATYTGAFVTNNVWYSYEIEVVINNTTGSIAIRKNGNPANDFFLGSLNTRTSTNNYANQLRVGSVSAATQYFDDFLWRSDATTVPWVGDIRCFTRYPSSDVQAQFSRSPATTNLALNGNFGGSTYGANACSYARFVAPVNGVITSSSVLISGASTAHVKTAIFTSNPDGTVGTVMATSSEATNPPAGTLTFTFASPPRIVIGQNYWIGINQDANVNFNISNTGNAINLTVPYSTWPQSNPGGVPASPNIPGVLTVYIAVAANFDAVSEYRQDATGTYVYSSTNGQNDLYGISSISAIPVSILGVVTRGYFQKSDAGTRNATIQMKSGSTTVQGVNTTLQTTVWNWISRTDTVDPATGAAWTATGVNNLQIGPVITA